MGLSSLTLRDLEYMVAVADHEQFSKAAKACGVSQPGLSTQIKKTEDILGVQIFDRTSQRVRLSPTGRILVSQARRVLEETKILFDLAQPNREPLNTILRLGSVATLGPYLIPHVLDPMKKSFKNLQLNLREDLGETLLSELKTGNLDALLIPHFEDSTLQMIPLFFEPYLVVFPKEHPFLQKKEVYTKDLDPEDMVLLEDGHCLKDDALVSLPPSKIRRSPKLPRYQYRYFKVLGRQWCRLHIDTSARHTSGFKI